MLHTITVPETAPDFFLGISDEKMRCLSVFIVGWAAISRAFETNAPFASSGIHFFAQNMRRGKPNPDIEAKARRVEDAAANMQVAATLLLIKDEIPSHHYRWWMSLLEETGAEIPESAKRICEYISNGADREMVGLIAAMLYWGNLNEILKDGLQRLALAFLKKSEGELEPEEIAEVQIKATGVRKTPKYMNLVGKAAETLASSDFFGHEKIAPLDEALKKVEELFKAFFMEMRDLCEPKNSP